MIGGVTNAVLFKKAVGSKDDVNLPANATDIYDATRFSTYTEVDKAFLTGILAAISILEIGFIEIVFYKGKERKTKIEILFSVDPKAVDDPNFQLESLGFLKIPALQ